MVNIDYVPSYINKKGDVVYLGEVVEPIIEEVKRLLKELEKCYAEIADKEAIIARNMSCDGCMHYDDHGSDDCDLCVRHEIYFDNYRKEQSW